MKTVTKVLIGAGAAGALYFLGKGAVRTMCQAEIQANPGGQLLAQFAAGVVGAAPPTPQAQCEMVVDSVPMFTAVKLGVVQFWRPITPADLA